MVMGIPGLTTYVNDIGKLWKKFNLQNTDVVVDGNCVIYYLYSNSGIDFKCGGEYDEFAGMVAGFFLALRRNRVIPYVVIDGAMDPSDRKLETLVKRAKDRVKTAGALSSGDRRDSNLLLPRLAKVAVVQVMESLKVKYVVSDCEADQEIASLANHLGCPVISNDSDFFILDIKHGYIPLTSLDWYAHPPYAEIFKRRRLAAHLKLTPELLPLVASLLGNDFISSQALEHFQAALKRIQPPRQSSRRAARILSIAYFLSSYTKLEEGLNAILLLIKDFEPREELKEAVETSLAGYSIPDSNLTEYFEQGLANSSLRNINNEIIPPWVLLAFRKALFPGVLVDSLTTGKRFLRTQVEDMRELSANCCTAEIRSVIYSIMDPNHNERKKTESENMGIKEWDRNGKCLGSCYLLPCNGEIEGYGKLPALEDIPSLGVKNRKDLFLAILGCNTDAIKHLPSDFQLYAASFRYCIVHADPLLTESHLDAIILTTLELHNVIESREGFKYLVPWKRKPHRKLDHSKGTVYDIRAQHSFAQWQAVMHEGIYLNWVLMGPLTTPDISMMFSGVTAQQMADKLHKGAAPQDLTKKPELYQQLRQAVIESVIHKLQRPSNAQEGTPVQDKPKHKQKQRMKESKETPAVLANNKFAALNLLDSDSDSSLESSVE